MSLSTRTKVKPPTNLSVTYSASGGFSANITWTPIESGKPIDYYVIYRDGNELVSGLLSASYRDSTVLEGQDYYYSVATVNVSETESVQTSGELLEVPAYPVWDTGISLSIVQGQSASVASRCTDPRGLSLTFARSGGTAPSGVTINSAGLISVSITAVAGTYTLLSDASNGVLSTTSGVISIVVQATAVAPSPPGNFVAQAISSSRIDLSWSAPQVGIAPDDYDLDFSTVGASGPWTSLNFTGTATIRSHTGLSAATTYYYRLRANKSGLSSAYVATDEQTQPSSGTNWNISSGTTNYDASPVQPGDTITLLRGSGTRLPLRITGLNPVGARVTIRTDPAGQAIMRANTTQSGGFTLEINNCHNFVFDGSTSGVEYGLKVTYSSASNPGQPSAFIQFTGGTDDFEMHHVWVDGGYPDPLNATGIGIQHNDQSVTRSGGLFCDGIEIHHCLVENIPHEGMYIGPNWVATGRPLKNVEIHHNIVRNCGWDAIQGKMWWEGVNSVHDNEIEDVGNKASTQAQLCGISVLSGPVSIYNNTVLGTGQQGIQSYTDGGPAYNTAFSGYGPYQVFEASIYNNVVARSGQLMGGWPGVGITVGQKSGTVTQRGLVYSNTVVDCNDTSITNNGSAAGDFTKNNICAGNTSGGVAANTPTGATQTANTTSTSPSSIFAPGVDNYHLAAETAAVTGTKGVDYSDNDIEGTPRTGTASRGAYEYS